MTKHVVVSSYTLYCTDVCVVEFDGSAEELQAALNGETDCSDEFYEDLADGMTLFNSDQPHSAERSVTAYEAMADRTIPESKEGLKVSDLPVVTVG